MPKLITNNEIRKILKQKNGILLSKYKTARIPLKIKCKICNNILYDTYHNIRRRKMCCKKCSKNKLLYQ